MSHQKGYRLVAALVLCVSVCLPSLATDAVEVTSLRCEYLTNPLAIDEPRPRLSWILQSTKRAQTQTAYRVLVASTKKKLMSSEGDLWDSGKVDSVRSVNVVYRGRELQSRMKCYWKVRVWDKDGKASAWSEPATWGMGLLRESEWRAHWIGGEKEEPRARKKEDFLDQAPQGDPVGRTHEAVYLRRQFDLRKKVKYAEVSACGLGFQRLLINGEPVTEDRLDPAQSDYGKRVLYQTYDVTDKLREGENVVAAVLGNGWYNLISRHALQFHRADWIAPPKLIMNLKIEYKDGAHTELTTDKLWKFSYGPVTYNCVLGGMTYDARLEMPRWAAPGFDDTKWQGVHIMPAPQGQLVAQTLAPVRPKVIKPVAVTEQEKGVYRIDTGLDTAGVARIKVRGRRGQTITLTYPGLTTHSGKRYQMDQYICRGDGEEVFEPFFTYHGFRYVDVSGLDYEPKLEDVEIISLHTHFASSGSFECSNPDMNRLHEVVRRTGLNYIRHLPQDPVREKVPWTEDAWNMFDTMAFNFDSVQMYRHWQKEFLVSQLADGLVPPVVPSAGWHNPDWNGPWWGGVIVVVPWKLYEYYGDKRILEESYESMVRWMDKLGTLAEGHIVKWSLGDWVEVGVLGFPVRTPRPLTGTAAYYHYADIMSKVGAVLGRESDTLRYRQLAQKIAEALNNKFLNRENGLYAKDSQGAQVMALWLGYAPESMRNIIHKQLVDNIHARNDHLSTGFVTTTMLLRYLLREDPVLAYRIASQKDEPGFLALVRNGSLYESWDGRGAQMPSLGGPVGAYLFEGILGIRRDGDVPAFRKSIIMPQPQENLTWAKGYHLTPYGKIASRWEAEASRFTLSVTIPCNTTATVYIPAKSPSDVTESGKATDQAEGVRFMKFEKGKAVFSVGSGHYEFVSTRS